MVKTEELLLGLPPSNLGDMLATDLRDLFTPVYNGITADMLTFNLVARYEATPEGRKVWALVKQLDTSAPDRDSHRLGALGRLSMAADQLHTQAAADHKLGTAAYRRKQRALYAEASAIVWGRRSGCRRLGVPARGESSARRLQAPGERRRGERG